MKDESPSDSRTAPSNRVAPASLVIALTFFVLSLILQAFTALLFLPSVALFVEGASQSVVAFVGIMISLSALFFSSTSAQGRWPLFSVSSASSALEVALRGTLAGVNRLLESSWECSSCSGLF
jgi:hypothetical protein